MLITNSLSANSGIIKVSLLKYVSYHWLFRYTDTDNGRHTDSDISTDSDRFTDSDTSTDSDRYTDSDTSTDSDIYIDSDSWD